MARLDPKPYPGEWEYCSGKPGDWMENCKRIDKQFKSIPQDKIIRFAVADSYAYYFVKSLKPLVLQHIPYGDKWQIPMAHIRGLRLKDVKEMLEWERNMIKIFREND